MRNLIKISQNCGLHYRNSTTNSSVSSHTTFKNISPDKADDGFGIGLDIPPDDIDDIFWVTDDVSDWFLDKADVSGYFDEFDDKGNLINVQVPAGQDTAARVKGDIAVKNETPTLKSPAVQKLRKLDDQRLVRRNKTTEETNKIVKKSVVLPLDEAAIERKLTDTKRKINQAYEDKAKKQRKVKVIEFIPPPLKLSVPPHPKKDRTPHHKKDYCLSRPKKDDQSMQKKIACRNQRRRITV